MGLLALFRRKPHERTGFELYGAAVAAARDPWFFDSLGVPDTLDGRFDLVGLHVALLIRRLRTDPDKRGATLAQAVFDAMFADMDINLREMGASDMSIGKRVKRMWEAFHGRARAYEAALDDAGHAALEGVLARNIWNGQAPDGAAALLAARVHALSAGLRRQPLDDLAQGRVIYEMGAA